MTILLMHEKVPGGVAQFLAAVLRRLFNRCPSASSTAHPFRSALVEQCVCGYCSTTFVGPCPCRAVAASLLNGAYRASARSISELADSRWPSRDRATSAHETTWASHRPVRTEADAQVQLRTTTCRPQLFIVNVND